MIKMSRIIGIVSGKGGVGKTTIGINLGAALTKNFGKNVTLVDCNVTTSHVGLYLGMYYCPITLNKVLRDENSIDEAINNHYTGLKVVPASLSLNDLEGVDLTKLRNNLKKLFESNDLVILDVAPGLGREAIAAMRACDEIVYVTNPFVPSVMDIVRTEEVARELEIDSLGIIVNMSNKKKYEMTNDEIREITKLPVLAKIPYDTKVHKSLHLKMPLTMLHPEHKFSKEINKAASHITGEVYLMESTIERLLKRLRLDSILKKEKRIVEPNPVKEEDDV